MFPQNGSELPEDVFGCITSESTHILSENDQKLADLIRQKSKGCIIPRLDWPIHEVKPISVQ